MIAKDGCVIRASFDQVRTCRDLRSRAGMRWVHTRCSLDVARDPGLWGTG